MRLAALQEAPYAFGSKYEFEVNRTEAEWRASLKSRTRYLLEVDGEPAGTVSGGPADSPGAAAITAMWVDPRFRRRGIGDVLIKRILDWAQENDYSECVLWVTEVNAAAQRLYERNGFRRTGSVSQVRPDEEAVEYEMVRNLRA